MNSPNYYPYGKILRKYTNGSTEKFLTTQHERDAETGLDYRGARFYDADIARFLSLDPLAASFASWSPYNYVIANPLIFSDPTGKAPETQILDVFGNVVYDDYQDDGEIFMLREAFDLDKLKVKGLDLTDLKYSFQLTMGSYWQGTEKQFHMFVTNQAYYAGGSISDVAYGITSIAGEEKGYMSTNTVTYSENKDGSYTLSLMKKSNRLFNVNYDKINGSFMLDNVYNIRNTIAHEYFHFSEALVIFANGKTETVSQFRLLNKFTAQREMTAILSGNVGNISWSQTTAEYKDFIKGYFESARAQFLMYGTESELNNFLEPYNESLKVLYGN